MQRFLSHRPLLYLEHEYRTLILTDQLQTTKKQEIIIFTVCLDLDIV